MSVRKEIVLEHEEYAKASRSFNRIWKERDSAQPKLLEAILYKDNLNRAYKRVKANKGAAGIDERVKRPTSEYEDEEMEANTDIYAEFIISTVERIKETCPHPLVMVEERLDYSYLVPSGFGTGDCVIIADGTLYVMDYKNGKGVFVNCDHNPQMMLYALGAYHAYGYLYNIKQVSMTIIQPRLENISTFECSVEELLDWAETYVRPRAKLAFEGKGEQVPGDWCRFCLPCQNFL